MQGSSIGGTDDENNQQTRRANEAYVQLCGVHEMSEERAPDGRCYLRMSSLRLQRKMETEIYATTLHARNLGWPEVGAGRDRRKETSNEIIS